MADEQTQGNQTVLDLDGQVDQLLQQMDSECARIESNTPVREPSEVHPDAPDDDREFAEPADTVKPAAPPPPPSPEPVAADAEPTPEETKPDSEPISETDLDTNLDAKVGEMIAQAEQDEAEQDAPPPLSANENEPIEGEAASTTQPESEDESTDEVESVDACLADLTSQLLEGGIDMPEDDAANGASKPEANFEAGTTEHAASNTSTHRSPGTTKSNPKSQAKSKAKKIPLAAVVVKTKAVTAGAWNFALPIGASGVVKLSSPLENRSDTIRQTVGWMALYTGFLSLCVWGYVLMVRTPEAPAANAVAAQLVDGQGSPAADQGPDGSSVGSVVSVSGSEASSVSLHD